MLHHRHTPFFVLTKARWAVVSFSHDSWEGDVVRLSDFTKARRVRVPTRYA